MARKAHDLLTLDDLDRMPRDDYRYELHRGYMVREPAPGARHGRIEAVVVAALQAFVAPRRLGVVLTNVSFLLARGPDTVRAPDVAFVARERYRMLADESRPFPGAPDLAVEVLSPGNRDREMDARVRDLLDGGTEGIWLLDPHTEVAQVLDATGSTLTLRGDDLLRADRSLPGFALPVHEVFRLDL